MGATGPLSGRIWPLFGRNPGATITAGTRSQGNHMRFSKAIRGLTTTVALAAMTAASAPPFQVALARDVADGQPTAAAPTPPGFRPPVERGGPGRPRGS